MTRRKSHQRLGQNFLVDRGVAAKVVRRLGDEPPRIAEIGPGKGALTRLLVERFDRVLALELDEELAKSLPARVPGGGLEVRLGDALRADLDELLGAEGPWQVAGNLPYSVGTAILRRLLPRHDLVTRAVVMLQREVAGRVVATPGKKSHGLLALERAAYARAEVVFDVPPQAFRPRPRVMSSVIVLDLHPPAYPADELAAAFALAAAALTKPRKMLHNALGERADEAAIERAGLDPCQRPATVDLGGWVRLAAATE